VADIQSNIQVNIDAGQALAQLKALLLLAVPQQQRLKQTLHLI